MKQILFSKSLAGGIGQTLSTRIFTRLRGIKVGEDEMGNIYYKGKKDGRRWVIYNGPAEASRHSAGLAWLDALPHRCCPDR